MILFSLGFPGAFAEWCDRVAAQLALRSLGPTEIVPANTLEDLARQLIRTDGHRRLVVSRQPDARMRQCHADNIGRVVLALGDPREAVAHRVVSEGLDLVTAIRVVANSCATLTGYLRLPNVLVLREGHDGADARAAAAAIAEHLGLPATSTDIAEILASLPAPASRQSGAAREIQAWQETLDTGQRELIDGALGAYVEYFKHGSFGKLIWGRQLFFLGDCHSAAPIGNLDITGRSRCLIFGPYLIVPPGSWTAHVTLGCSNEVAGMSFFIEVFTSAQLGSTILQPDKGGIFEANLEFTIGNTENTPIEVRIYNQRAAFDGRLGLGRVVIVPRMRELQDRERELISALGLATQ
jgi:hypothetical protein